MKHIHHHTHTDTASGHDHHSLMIEDFKKRFWISLILTLPIAVLSPMIQKLAGYEFHFMGDKYLQFTLASIIFFYGGWPFLTGLISEIKKKMPGMMTLIALAITVAYLYGAAVVWGLTGSVFFWELASLIDIMLLGHWIEMKSVMSTSNALQELIKMRPSTARKINKNGEYKDIPSSELKKNDIILIRPGEKIPADGTVIEGSSTLDESMLTGESKPVGKQHGDKVIGGSINQQGALSVKVSHVGSESYLANIINTVEEAQKTKSKTQNLSDKAAAWLFYIALSAGIITFLAWLGLGMHFDYALERMVTVMVITCPHALGLAVPLVVAISTAACAQQSLLIRNRTAFENARLISAIIFDKTGTLTKGKFEVIHFKSLVDTMDDNEILQMAASIEKSSEHPIATGIMLKAKTLDLTLQEAREVNNITGRGIKGWLKNQEITIAGPGMVKEKGLKNPLENSIKKDQTTVFILSTTAILGYIVLAHEIREDTKAAIQWLQSKKIKCIMATGDNEHVARTVSQSLALDHYHAEVLPEDKQQIIQALQARGNFVAMVGDGINDAPALAQANVGIAVGSGTHIAAETADIIMVQSNLKDIAKVIAFGRATYKKILQNLWWATGYNIVAIPLAAGILSPLGIVLSPAAGAVLMSLSTVIAAFNAQLLKTQIKPK